MTFTHYLRDGQIAANFFHYRHASFEVGVGNAKDEFFAPIAEEAIIRPDMRFHVPGKIGKDPVAGVMAISIVHLLEVIEVQHCNARRMYLADNEALLLAQLRQHPNAASCPGQRVKVEKSVLEFVLRRQYLQAHLFECG